jgi:hypothetical protein
LSSEGSCSGSALAVPELQAHSWAPRKEKYWPILQKRFLFSGSLDHRWLCSCWRNNWSIETMEIHGAYAALWHPMQWKR